MAICPYLLKPRRLSRYRPAPCPVTALPEVACVSVLVNENLGHCNAAGAAIRPASQPSGRFSRPVARPTLPTRLRPRRAPRLQERMPPDPSG